MYAYVVGADTCDSERIVIEGDFTINIYSETESPVKLVKLSYYSVVEIEA